MEPADAGKIEEIFCGALELRGADRLAYLDRACPDDARLRSEVDSLLECHERAEAGDAGILAATSGEAPSVAALLRARSLASGQFGLYAVEEWLGEGATGIVYRALDTRSNQTVALKVGSPRTLLDPDSLRRFKQAATASKDLNHPHIARVWETGVEQGVPYLAMEFVDGRSLAEVMRGERLSLAAVMRLGREIASPLASAHANGLIHRDLKPANVMVGPDGAKVLDFGLCHAAAGRESIAGTETGPLLGTPGYLAPELARGLAPSPRSDLFSLGAVLYEMLAGVPAFPGETSVARLSSVLHGRPAWPRGVPAAVLRIVERCLEKEPSRRPASAAEVASAFGKLEQGLSSGRVRVRPVWDRLASRASRLSRRAAIGAAAGVLALGGAVAGIWLRQPAHRPFLTQVTFDRTALNKDPAISPDRRWIAFASDRGGDGNLDLWLVPASGGNARRLTRQEINTRQPEFSPDGRTVLYRSDRNGGGIYQVSVDEAAGSTVPTRLVAGGLRPKFSPDGKRIAYWTGLDTSGDVMGPGASKVYLMPVKGGGSRQICPKFASAAYPIWSPDGKSLLFTGRRRFPYDPPDPIVWITGIDDCAAIPLGTPASFNNIDQPLGTPVVPERWLKGGRLLFREMEHVHATGLLEVRFSISTGNIREPPKGVGLPVNGVNGVSVLDESTIALAQLRYDTSLWTMPLDSAGGGDGPPGRFVECAAEECIPSLSPDGAVLFYSRLENKWEFVRREFGKDQETIVEGPGPSSAWPFVAGREADLLYLKPSGYDVFSIVRVLGKSGKREIFCGRCPELWDVSGSERWLLGMSGRERRTVSLVETATQRVTELLSHPQWNLYRASFSPDERSIVFTAKLAPDRSQVLVAGSDGRRCAPPEAWVAISGATEYNGPARWSADGTRIYFVSQQDGHRCFYSRAWDRARCTVSGPITAVRHFHAEGESPGLIPQSLFGFAVARDKIVFAMGKQFGDIWLFR